MMRRVIILFVLVLQAGSVRAILPPDAKAREPQLRAYRQRLNENYEKKLVERQEEAIRAYEKTRADIFTPPWMRGEQAALQSGAEAVAQVEADRTHKKIRRILISIMSLALIIGGAGWVWYKTRETDE
ncbi:MAG: hypothetical protein WCG03_03210 [Kiritimatiellales bacterium]